MFRKAEANFQTDDVFICLSVILPFYDRVQYVINSEIKTRRDVKAVQDIFTAETFVLGM